MNHDAFFQRYDVMENGTAHSNEEAPSDFAFMYYTWIVVCTRPVFHL